MWPTLNKHFFYTTPHSQLNNQTYRLFSMSLMSAHGKRQNDKNPRKLLNFLVIWSDVCEGSSWKVIYLSMAYMSCLRCWISLSTNQENTFQSVERTLHENVCDVKSTHIFFGSSQEFVFLQQVHLLKGKKVFLLYKNKNSFFFLTLFCVKTRWRALDAQETVIYV